MESGNLLRTVLKPPKRPIVPKKNNLSNLTNLNFSPLNWTDYFDESRDLDVIKSKGKFRVYLNGFKNGESNAPVLVLLHGGGYSSLTWSLFVKAITEICELKVITFDLRGHGSTRTEADYDLSVDTLVDDIYNVLVCLFGDQDDCQQSNKSDANQTDESANATMDDIAYKPNEDQIKLPPLCIVGHSMGGALAVHASYKLSTVCTITGLIVIDVVEGRIVQFCCV